MKAHNGFTLIKSIIIIGILCTVAAIAIPPIYESYVLKEKLAPAFQELSAMKKELHIYFDANGHKKLPDKIRGINLTLHDGGVLQNVQESGVIEGYRYDSHIDKDLGLIAWYVVRIRQGVLPGDLSWRAREIHYAFVKNSSGEWESFCGSWNNGATFIDPKYLSKDCNINDVSQALRYVD